MFNLTYEFKLKPTTAQVAILDDWLDSSQCKALTADRKNSPELKRVQSQVLQQTLRRLEKAFVSIWSQGHGFPRYKKVGTMRSFSDTPTQAEIAAKTRIEKGKRIEQPKESTSKSEG